MESSSFLFRYGIVLMSVGLVIGAKLIIELWVGTGEPYLLFLAAVMASAYFGGFGPGLIATVLVAMASVYFFVTPVFSLSPSSLDVGLDVMLLLIEGIIISVAFQTLLKRVNHENFIRKEHEAYVASIAHELRNPLTSLLGWSEIMPALDAKQQVHVLKIMQRNLEVQSRLIEDLIDFSKMLDGKVSIEPIQLNFSEVVQIAVTSMEPYVQKKNLKLETSITPGLEMRGDSTRLHQMVTNLVGNAIKFTEKGCIFVGVNDRRTNLELVVRDTGRGVKAESMRYLFDRFWQEKEGAGSAGFGIGLWVVQHIVNLHSGNIRVESPGEGQGATFTVVLPK